MYIVHFDYIQNVQALSKKSADKKVSTLESQINEQVVYWEIEKNPTYTHLFGTMRLLIFSKKSHLYVYSHLKEVFPPILLLIFVLSLSNSITF